MVAAGRVLMGIQEAIIYILPTILAAHWFQDRELASVFSFQMIAMSIGGIACSSIFPNVFPYADVVVKNTDLINGTSEPHVTITTMTSPTNDDIAGLMSEREVATWSPITSYMNSGRKTKAMFPDMMSYPTATDDAIEPIKKYFNGIYTDLLTHKSIPKISITPPNDTSSYMEPYMSYTDQSLRLMLCFGMGSFIMFIAVILAFFYCQDHPPTPPSAAQEKILQTGKSPQQLSCQQSSYENFKEIIKLSKNRTFVLLCFVMFLSGSMMLLFTFLSSFVLETFPDLSNRTPGIMLTITYVMSGAGCLLGGKLCDKFKSSKVILLISK